MATPSAHAAASGLLLALALAAPPPVSAEIATADLSSMRSVSERDWLGLRLQVLGLSLSYPAYRVHLELSEDTSGPAAASIRYTFWLSAAMADHLMDAGRAETEKVLGYHGRGIGDQIAGMIENEFPTLWPRFDVAEDVAGRFLTPGKEIDDPPQELARWRNGELEWTYNSR